MNSNGLEEAIKESEERVNALRKLLEFKESMARLGMTGSEFVRVLDALSLDGEYWVNVIEDKEEALKVSMAMLNCASGKITRTFFQTNSQCMAEAIIRAYRQGYGQGCQDIDAG